MQKLIEKYNREIINTVIEMDSLTSEEIKDLDYLEDRIETLFSLGLCCPINPDPGPTW